MNINMKNYFYLKLFIITAFAFFANYCFTNNDFLDSGSFFLSNNAFATYAHASDISLETTPRLATLAAVDKQGVISYQDDLYYKTTQLHDSQKYLIGVISPLSDSDLADSELSKTDLSESDSSGSDLSGDSESTSVVILADILDEISASWIFTQRVGMGDASSYLSMGDYTLVCSNGALTQAESKTVMSKDRPEPPKEGMAPPEGNPGDTPPGPPSENTDNPDNSQQSNPSSNSIVSTGDSGNNRSSLNINYDGKYLSFVANKSTYYLTYDNLRGFSITENVADASLVSIYSSGEKLDNCIEAQPNSVSYSLIPNDYTTPLFHVGINEDVDVDNISWYIDDKITDYDSTIMYATELLKSGAGVHPVYCIVSGHDDDNIYYREKSYVINYIVANGVIDNSVFTFSDVHEEFENISLGIEQIMAENDGCIPSLIVCTGDWHNGSTANYEIMLSEVLPIIKNQIGGIDTVYVAGNHEESLCATIETVKADLGASNAYIDNQAGLIFSSKTAMEKYHAKSSKEALNLLVYGLNFYSITDEENNRDYENVIDDLKAFLDNAAKDYRGETVIISSHSGLHILGMQPESVGADNKEIEAWAGKESYNVNNSEKIVKLLNFYAEEYDMDIMFLFGHDHSKGEAEFILTPGDEIISTVNYQSSTYETIPLKFTYAHAGYLSGAIGSASNRYSLITWSEKQITYKLRSLNEEYTNEVVIPKYYKPQSGDEPGGDEPGGDEPGGDEPGGDEPGGDEPGGDKPGGDEPGNDISVISTPAPGDIVIPQKVGTEIKILYQESATTTTPQAVASQKKKVVYKKLNKTFKASRLKKSKKTYSIIRESGGGELIFFVKKGEASSVKVSKDGKVTVKKGAKKDIYKIKVIVAAKGEYYESSATLTIKIV